MIKYCSCGVEKRLRKQVRVQIVRSCKSILRKNLSIRALAAGLSACVFWGCAAGAMAAPSRALYDITPLERPEVEGLIVSPSDKLPKLTARSAVVMDAATGTVIYSRDMDARRYPASTTKIMTLIIALEQGNLDDIVTVSKNAAGLEGSTLWLEQGDKVPLRELLYGMMMASGNDATVAVAEHIAGSVPAFVRLMNEKAAAVGAKDTHFVNPNGLPDENHYTTAHDMALIASFGYSLPEFEKIVSTKEITFPWVKDDTHRLRNENQMLWLFEGGNGVKTGYTDAAGRCLVSGAREKGLQLVAVVLDSVYMWNDSIALLDYGFDNVEPEEIFRKGEIVGSVSVGLFQGELEVKAARDLSVARMKNGSKVKYDKKLEASENLTAPIKEGEKAGRIVLLQDGKPVGAVDVLAAKSLTAEEQGFFSRLIAWLQSLWKGLF